MSFNYAITYPLNVSRDRRRFLLEAFPSSFDVSFSSALGFPLALFLEELIIPTANTAPYIRAVIKAMVKHRVKRPKKTFVKYCQFIVPERKFYSLSFFIMAENTNYIHRQ